MADSFFDGVPRIGQNINTLVDQTEQSLGFLKDCFEATCANWSDTSTATLAVDKLDADPTFNDVVKHYSKISSTATEFITVSDLNPDGLYRLTVKSYSLGFYPRIRFNSDSGSNYTYSRQYSGQINNSTVHDKEVNESGTSLYLVGFVTSGTVILETIFGTVPGDTNSIIANTRVSVYSSENVYLEITSVGYYAGAAEMESILLYLAYPSYKASVTGAIERMA